MTRPNRGCDSRLNHGCFLAVATLAIASLACAGRGPIHFLGLGASDVEAITIFDPARSFEEHWEAILLSDEETAYELAFAGDRLALHAVAEDSASGLIQKIRIDPEECPTIEWWWRVDRVHEHADLHEKSGDDVAASIFLLFGNPEAGLGLRRVPTVRYVWTNGNSELNKIVDNPYLPGTVRNIVVQNDPNRVGRWERVRRDIVADFRASFDREPDDVIEAVALLTDSDQTHERVEAWYGGVRALCRPEDELYEEYDEEDEAS